MVRTSRRSCTPSSLVGRKRWRGMSVTDYESPRKWGDKIVVGWWDKYGDENLPRLDVGRGSRVLHAEVLDPHFDNVDHQVRMEDFTGSGYGFVLAQWCLSYFDDPMG